MHPTGARSVVAPRNLIFGLTRMYQVFNERTPAALRVFSDLDPAIEWTQEVHRGRPRMAHPRYASTCTSGAHRGADGAELEPPREHLR